MTTHKAKPELVTLIEQGVELALARRESELSEAELDAASGGAQIKASDIALIKGGIAGRYELSQVLQVSEQLVRG